MLLFLYFMNLQSPFFQFFSFSMESEAIIKSSINTILGIFSIAVVILSLVSFITCWFVVFNSMVLLILAPFIFIIPFQVLFYSGSIKFSCSSSCIHFFSVIVDGERQELLYIFIINFMCLLFTGLYYSTILFTNSFLS